MTESPVIILGLDKEEWVVVAHRAGKWIPLSTSRFPVCGSYDEVIERVRIRCKVDPDFARRWRGYHLTGCRIDKQVDL